MTKIMDDEIVRAASHHAQGERAWLLAAQQVWAAMRAQHGFARVASPILTPPAANMKLHKSHVKTYGVTLQHHISTFERNGMLYQRNMCPWAGDCTKVCVLDNGNGSYESVQRARMAKTQLYLEHPDVFGYLLGFEIAQAVKRHEQILLRPNVNSDLPWHILAPSLTSGWLFGTSVLSYGYTKDPKILRTDGWADVRYRLAYSWNEKSQRLGAIEFLENGGAVAVVTARKKGEPPLGRYPFTSGYDKPLVRDADVTDEWMFLPGVIGDLSAKGKARKLIGRSGFVVTKGAS